MASYYGNALGFPHLSQQAPHARMERDRERARSYHVTKVLDRDRKRGAVAMVTVPVLHFAGVATTVIVAESGVNCLRHQAQALGHNSANLSLLVNSVEDLKCRWRTKVYTRHGSANTVRHIFQIIFMCLVVKTVVRNALLKERYPSLLEIHFHFS